MRETLRESLSFRESKDRDRDQETSIRDSIRDTIRDSVRQSIATISNKQTDRSQESDVETLYDLLDSAAVVGALFRSHSTDEIGKPLPHPVTPPPPLNPTHPGTTLSFLPIPSDTLTFFPPYPL